MKNILDKIFLRSNNFNYITHKIKALTKEINVEKIFGVINSFSSESEIRFVGGCIRKIINNEKVDDIDLATNLEPNIVCQILKDNNIDYFESGIEHGTITALINNQKFEITTLREDVFTDGRHAKVKFSKNWKEDASRRDFTINSIYADREGNLFDPFNGKSDLENGQIHFIGDAHIRIKEDYLRIIRYLRFFLFYSKKPHDIKIIKLLKMNIEGISKLSKERLFNELKKILKIEIIKKLNDDKQSLELFLIIFPELKNIKATSRLIDNNRDIIDENDFIFILSLILIDGTDNTDYFLYKFNLSKKDYKRIKLIDNFYKEKLSINTFTIGNLNKIFYFEGKQAVIDVIKYKILKSKKFDLSLKDLYFHYINSVTPTMPINADLLMNKYKIPQGKKLGQKLKTIELEWVKNNFQISEKQLENIVNN